MNQNCGKVSIIIIIIIIIRQELDLNSIVHSKGRLRPFLNFEITSQSLEGIVGPRRDKSYSSNSRTRAIGGACVILVQFGTHLWLSFHVISSAYTKLRPEL